MGASAWHHFVRHEADVAAALQRARWEVFRSGKYFRRPKSKKLPPFESFVPPDPDIWNYPDELADWSELYAREFGVSAPPSSPDEALAQGREDGTHSVIDIRRVGPSKGPGVAAPVAQAQLRELFGSDTPTRDAVEKRLPALFDTLARGEAAYVVVYEGAAPSELLFAGLTGD